MRQIGAVLQPVGRGLYYGMRRTLNGIDTVSRPWDVWGNVKIELSLLDE